MNPRAQLLVGHVMHRRLKPAVNRFVYPVFCIRIPLRQLDAIRGPLFSVDRFNLLAFHCADHGARDGSPLLPWLDAKLRERGLQADGEIVLQTFPRVLGYVFNPVSFWFCHDRQGALVAVLAEVNNTFGGKHAYVLANSDGAPLHDGQELRAGKRFHVSPFCGVEGSYRFRFHHKGGRTVARIEYDDAQGALLHAAISAEVRPWSSRALLAAFVRTPLLTVGVVARIHWQALRLWMKGIPFRGAAAGIDPVATAAKAEPSTAHRLDPER